MGEVYVVKHVVLGSEFAAKVIAPQFAGNAKAVERMLAEAQGAARIRHDNVVSVTHAGKTAANHVFIVMELLEGEDLQKRLAERSAHGSAPLPDDETREIVRGVLAGLQAVHDAGIVHRDLKPANIYLARSRGTSGFRPVILDFGISKSPVAKNKTTEGAIMGTPHYMAPEAAEGSTVGPPADIYSIGVILYELVTGRLPFDAELPVAVLVQHVSSAPPAPTRHRPDLPASVEGVILRCLSKKPGDRFQSARELSAAWETAWARPSPPRPWWRRSPRASLSVWALVLVGLAAIGWVISSHFASPRLRHQVTAFNADPGDEFGGSVAISGNTLVVGAYHEDGGGYGDQLNNDAPDSGAVYVLIQDGSGWTQQAYLKASNLGANDLFGTSVAISGDTIVVGAPREDSDARGVNNLFYVSDSALDAGAAYVFVRNGSDWTQQAYLKPLNTGPEDRFGWSVAIDGDTIVVGAHGEDSAATGVNGDRASDAASESGAAYVFVRRGTTWVEEAYLKASNAGVGDGFGESVSIAGDTIVVGAFGESSAAVGVNGDESSNAAPQSGAAYVFRRRGSGWAQEAYLKASNTNAFDRFGSVAISGDTLVVGAANERSSATSVNGDELNNDVERRGAAYVFVRSGTTWTQRAYLKASSSGSGSFGTSVGIANDRIVVGAPTPTFRVSTLVLPFGAAEIPVVPSRNGDFYLFVPRGATWAEETHLTASTPSAVDAFGWSVAVAPGGIAVGAPRADGPAPGIDGEIPGHSLPACGAVYTFD